MSDCYGSSGPGSANGILSSSNGVINSMDDSMHTMSMQPGRPLSECSATSCGPGGPSPIHRSGSSHYLDCNGNPQDDLINDEVLMSLSVRELNKRLHGCPREEVSQVSQFLPYLSSAFIHLFNYSIIIHKFILFICINIYSTHFSFIVCYIYYICVYNLLLYLMFVVVIIV